MLKPPRLRSKVQVTLILLFGAMLAAAVACGGGEKTVIQTVVVEKPVTQIQKVVETVVVEKQVPGETRVQKVVETVLVEKPVTRVEKVVETVVVEKEVAGKTVKVVETVLVEKPVQVEKKVVETVLVEKVVVATPTPAPLATAKPVEQFGTFIFGTDTILPPAFVPFDGAISDHWGIKEPLLWRETATPAIGPLRPDQSIAESWDLAPDLSKITFHIRKGIPFHKGWGEVTARDVVWSFNNGFEEGNTNARSGFIGAYLRNWELVDDYTAVANVFPPLSSRWSVEMSNQWRNTVSIQSKKVFDELGEEEANVTFVGTGPFVAEEWRADERIVANALPKHYRETAKVKRLVVLAIPEEAALVAAFKVGEIHIARLPASLLGSTLASIPGARRVDLSGGQTTYVTFGGNYWAHTDLKTGEDIFPRPGFLPDDKHPWIGDPRDDASMQRALKVRQALAMAIDRKLISETVEEGLSPVTYTWMGFLEDNPLFKEEWRIPFDPKAAKALLAEAGFPNGFDGGKFWGSDTFNWRPLAEVVAAMWEDIGVKVEIESTAYSAKRPSLLERNIPQLYIMRIKAGDFSDPRGRLVSTQLGGANRGVELPDEIIKNLYLANLVELDDNKRIANNVKLQDYLSKWRLFAPMVVRRIIYGVRPEVLEWHPYTENFGTFNAPWTITLKR